MKIAIDIQPLQSTDQYRGVGSYTKVLVNAVEKHDQENKYLQVTKEKVVGKIDLLIIPYFSPFEITLPFKKITKTLVTIHDLIPLRYPQHFEVGIKGKLKWYLQKLLLNQIDGVLTDSAASSNDIIKTTNVPQDKIFVVYPAVDRQFQQIKDHSFLSNIRNKYKLAKDFVLYVGDCNWNKNVPTLVRACQKLDLHLVLVGKVFLDRSINLEHPWNKSVKEVLKLTDNYDKVRKVGYISTLDLAAFYNLATVYVQPSFYEGFGLPVIEAMSCNCPVISSVGGSLLETGGQAALYFHPAKSDQLIAKIKKVYSNYQLRNQLKEKGLKQAGKFSEKKMLESLKNVYQKIV